MQNTRSSKTGILPGPFSGLQWYTLNAEQVNPDEFSKWLSERNGFAGMTTFGDVEENAD